MLTRWCLHRIQRRFVAARRTIPYKRPYPRLSVSTTIFPSMEMESAEVEIKEQEKKRTSDGLSFITNVIGSHTEKLRTLEEKILDAEEKRRKLLTRRNPMLEDLPRLEKEILSGDGRCRFVPVGSAVTGLAASLSDLDVVLLPMNVNERNLFLNIFHRNDAMQHEFMSVLRASVVRAMHNSPLASTFRETATTTEDTSSLPLVKNCLIFPHLRVPLLICQLTTGHSLDIAIPCSRFQAIRNSALMRCYVQTDVRLCQLLVWLREWSTAMGIRESKLGLMSTYNLLTLAVHFLQSEDALSPPVLPVLSLTHNHLFNPNLPIEKVLQQLEQPPHRDLQSWKSRNTMSTAELVVRFIDYYHNCDLLKRTIKLGTGEAIRRDSNAIDRVNILEPYNYVTVCKSLNAGRAFLDAVDFTRKKMLNGLMIDSFPSFSEASTFTGETELAVWRVSSLKKRMLIDTKHGRISDEATDDSVKGLEPRQAESLHIFPSSKTDDLPIREMTSPEQTSMKNE